MKYWKIYMYSTVMELITGTYSFDPLGSGSTCHRCWIIWLIQIRLDRFAVLAFFLQIDAFFGMEDSDFQAKFTLIQEGKRYRDETGGVKLIKVKMHIVNKPTNVI